MDDEMSEELKKVDEFRKNVEQIISSSIRVKNHSEKLPDLVNFLEGVGCIGRISVGYSIADVPIHSNLFTLDKIDKSQEEAWRAHGVPAVDQIKKAYESFYESDKRYLIETIRNSIDTINDALNEIEKFKYDS